MSIIQRVLFSKLITNIPKRTYIKNKNEFNGEIYSSKSANDCDGEIKKWPTEKRIKFNFHPETETAFNQQINTEFKAFYNYLSMATYFGRADVALPGCQSYFTQMYVEEYEHAIQFLNYVNMRGGSVNLCGITPPSNQNWNCPLYAFKEALQLEVDVSNKLAAANEIAEKHKDLNASDFIISGFMESQMKSINEFEKFTTILSGIGDKTLSRFIFDKDLLDNYVQPQFNVLKNNNKEK
ncbi:soma ferritin-like [Microplitis mediator]|uniref:soma ferritin-like n=1 Tax=Microplitis mediator TaxID=375433 RepID=UPI00255545A6|nr:soma ferritin-like [Microplitis mediator]